MNHVFSLVKLKTLLKKSEKSIGEIRTQSEMCQPTVLGAEAGIYQSFSGLLSVLFRTN